MTLCLFVVLVERHRKEKINAGINRIGNLLPCSQALKQVRDGVSVCLNIVKLEQNILIEKNVILFLE